MQFDVHMNLMHFEEDRTSQINIDMETTITCKYVIKYGFFPKEVVTEKIPKLTETSESTHHRPKEYLFIDTQVF